MKQNYVIFKGKRYNSGDTMDILWYTNGYKSAYPYTGTFLDCDEEKDEYRFVVDGIIYCYNKVRFNRIIRKDTPIQELSNGKREPKKATFQEELNIDGLLIAWIWYVFIMAVATIFKGAICIWVIVSYIFFNYRKTKLKEAGYK